MSILPSYIWQTEVAIVAVTHMFVGYLCSTKVAVIHCRCKCRLLSWMMATSVWQLPLFDPAKVVCDCYLCSTKIAVGHCLHTCWPSLMLTAIIHECDGSWLVRWLTLLDKGSHCSHELWQSTLTISFFFKPSLRHGVLHFLRSHDFIELKLTLRLQLPLI